MEATADPPVGQCLGVNADVWRIVGEVDPTATVTAPIVAESAIAVVFVLAGPAKNPDRRFALAIELEKFMLTVLFQDGSASADGVTGPGAIAVLLLAHCGAVEMFLPIIPALAPFLAILIVVTRLECIAFELVFESVFIPIFIFDDEGATESERMPPKRHRDAVGRLIRTDAEVLRYRVRGGCSAFTRFVTVIVWSEGSGLRSYVAVRAE